MMIRLIQTSLILALFNAWAHGQMVSEIKIGTIAFDESIEKIYFKNDGKAEGISVSKNTLSAPFSYSGSLGIIFYATEGDLNNGGPEYGRVILPKDSNHVLLTFTPSPVVEEKGGKDDAIALIKSYAVETKAGSYCFYNNSKEKVDLELDGQKASIEPGGKAVLQSPDWVTEMKSLSISATSTSEDGKVTKLLSSVWGHRPERRYQVFIELSDDRFRKVKAHSFYDIP